MNNELAERAERFAAEGRRLFEEDARLSISDADGSEEVYFIQESGRGAIKIGITSDLRRRLQNMRCNTPHEVVALGSIYADRRLEGHLKRKFAKTRIRGEWFEPTDELTECIKSLTNFELAAPKRSQEDRNDPVGRVAEGLIDEALSLRIRTESRG